MSPLPEAAAKGIKEGLGFSAEKAPKESWPSYLKDKFLDLCYFCWDDKFHIATAIVFTVAFLIIISIIYGYDHEYELEILRNRRDKILEKIKNKGDKQGNNKISSIQTINLEKVMS